MPQGAACSGNAFISVGGGPFNGFRFILPGARPVSRRGPIAVRAELHGDWDPAEVHRLSRQANEPSRFFAVDGHAAPLSQDWRVFRAQLVAQEQGGSAPSAGLNTLVHPSDEWAHLISKPEQGCLLVARHASLGMFTHSVLLVSEHESEEGTSALILNTATPMNIACLGLEEWTTAAFGDNTLFLGGPMNKNLLHVLHGRPEVEGAMRILQGVYAGGVDSAIELVRSGDAPASDFRLLAGYSGWGPHQLEREVEDGAWWVVAASPALIHACLRATTKWEPSKIVPGEGDSKEQSWRRVLRAAGVDPNSFRH